MLDTGLNLWSVMMLIVTLVVLVPASVFLLAWVGARYLTWLTQHSKSNQEQFDEIYRSKKQRIEQWERVGCLLVLAFGTWFVLTAVMAKWQLMIAGIVISLPILIILSGVQVADLRYTWSALPFLPIRLIVGPRAVWRGRILVIIGLLLLTVCGGFSLLFWQLS